MSSIDSIGSAAGVSHGDNEEMATRLDNMVQDVSCPVLLSLSPYSLLPLSRCHLWNSLSHAHKCYLLSLSPSQSFLFLSLPIFLSVCIFFVLLVSTCLPFSLSICLSASLSRSHFFLNYSHFLPSGLLYSYLSSSVVILARRTRATAERNQGTQGVHE